MERPYGLPMIYECKEDDEDDRRTEEDSGHKKKTSQGEKWHHHDIKIDPYDFGVTIF